MKRINLHKWIAGMCITVLGAAATGCMENELYAPQGNENQPLPEGSYFGFEMRGDVKLDVNYNVPGLKALIEVYDENPMQASNVKKEGIKPIYSAYTNDGKYAGTMRIPTAVKTAYLYTDNPSLPQCVQLSLTQEGASYTAGATAMKSMTKATTKAISTESWFQGEMPYDLSKSIGAPPHTDNFYSLCKWDINGHVRYINPYMSETQSYYTPDYVAMTTEVKGDQIGSIANRVISYFDNYEGNRKDLLKSADVTNIKTTQDGTILDIVILAERAAYYNTFGYYYYKAGNAPQTGEDFKAMKKYIICPDASIEASGSYQCGSTIRLKYFGADGNQAPQDEFPKDYRIGWFFISNGCMLGSTSGTYGWIRTCDYSSSTITRNIFFSNDEGEMKRFVSIVDAKTNTVALGFEDQQRPNNNEDYSDLLFFVKSNVDLDNSDKPVIPDENPELKPGVETIEGTLSFEDIWPSGGDYDMNDVVVEYKRELTFNEKNEVTKVVETFTPVHDGATYNSYFSYQVDNMGLVTLPEGCLAETATNSIVINQSVKQIINKTYTIERIFASGVSKQEIETDFNPYIIVGGYSTSNRKEVHLPKHKATSFADQSLIASKDDAYYVDKNGKYPFAFDIPMTGFTVVTDMVNIGVEYPRFNKWAESKGEQCQDWYKYYKQE